MISPPIERLWAAERDDGEGRQISAQLAAAYDGPLSLPLGRERPTVIVNFVSTLDGVVSFATPEATGGGEVSGFFAPDRFVMGLLRSLADVVLIGAGTLRDAAPEPWSAASIYPEAAAAFGELRRSLGLPAEPTTAIATASGGIDAAHPGLAHPGVPVRILTTTRGAASLASRAAHLSVEAIGQEQIAPHDLVGALARDGAQVILCEGGPRLLGQLLAADLVDEIFLTTAPQIAGRDRGVQRLSLVEGVAFDVDAAPWWRLASVRRSGSHLFLRYRLDREAARRRPNS
jgi:riboflavin biosynthesis pyrimidine reductase